MAARPREGTSAATGFASADVTRLDDDKYLHGEMRPLVVRLRKKKSNSKLESNTNLFKRQMRC